MFTFSKNGKKVNLGVEKNFLIVFFGSYLELELEVRVKIKDKFSYLDFRVRVVEIRLGFV